MTTGQLDISIEDQGSNVLVRLEGIFLEDQIELFQKKLMLLIDDGNKNFILDVHRVEFRSVKIVPMLLQILNNLKGRSGSFVLLMNSEQKHGFFARWNNIFTIYSSIEEMNNSGFIKNLRRTGVLYSRKTGVRLTPGVALVLLLLLGGWLLTLISIIKFQDEEIAEQNKYIHQLEVQKEKVLQDITTLQHKLLPLKHLGLVSDSLENASFTFVSDWVQYRELLEKRQNPEVSSSAIEVDSVSFEPVEGARE